MTSVSHPPCSPISPLPNSTYKNDKPGRSLVIVNETTNIILWLLPSPARGSALALSLDRGCRFSLFFRKAVHANAQLFCSLGPQDRENRQPLDRERDPECLGINRAKPASVLSWEA